MRQAIGSFLFNVGFYLLSTVLAIVGLPVLALPARAVTAYARIWTRASLALLQATCRLTHRVHGFENLPSGPCIIASKHQSTWETLAFTHVFPDGAFVLKRDLFYIPVVGWMMWRARNIGIDRSAGPSALRSILRDARRALDAGRPIVIFPEGTRTAVGAEAPYQPGVAALYTQLKVPVVPVALNSGLFWGRRTFIKKPGTITVEILPPIAPGMARADFMQALRDRIETATQRLAAEPPMTKE
ncbi:1-acyl-sn-glycerol-3-phosphate acyltransferase [Reyranella sp. CPCC 100927]|uniref:lysophospholipid acyltransferase family protein n=1 Tax=Reyranella sp. CPCC 100927 TaxID=2599616 RepID=UPI0011B64523|nr:lysophospholipid acyltransferase family protein [Reyranella sp. CPCC 100927]TWT14188.1 1-acyl-sn-glycerol-3-phosphate acyltransferase [Reyranella sp. CPCC 100927]